MATDIYCFVEEKMYRYTDLAQLGKWISTDKWTKNVWAALHPDSDKATRWEVQPKDMVFTARNYNLFAILANQWNSINMPYISDSRGLPEDISKEIRLQIKYSELHSATWFTARELLEFNWNQLFEFGVTMDGEKRIETVNYKECGSEFLNVLKCLVGSKNPSEIRLIVAFDN
jgi:hypothetical protein